MVMRKLWVGALASIYSPENWNAAFAGDAKELQDFLGWEVFGDSDSGYGVRGFNATAAALNVTVKRGGGLSWGAADAGDSRWRWIYHGADVVKAIGAHEAEPRVDLITASFTSGPDTLENVAFVGAPNGDVFTQRGTQVTINVVGGEPDADPWAEKATTPAGHIPLWYVYVPAVSGSLVLIDIRRMLAGHKERPIESPIQWVGDQTNVVAALATIKARKEALTGDATWTSALYYQIEQDWLAFLRLGPNAVNVLMNYPVCTPHTDPTATAPVTWRSAHAMFFADHTAAPANATLTRSFVGLVIERTGQNMSVLQAVQVPVEARGLRVRRALVRWKLNTVFDGTITTRSVQLLKVGPSGVPVTMGSVNLPLTSGAGVDNMTDISIGAAEVIDICDTVIALLQIITTTSGGTGDITIVGVDVMCEEGQQPNP